MESTGDSADMNTVSGRKDKRRLIRLIAMFFIFLPLIGYNSGCEAGLGTIPEPKQVKLGGQQTSIGPDSDLKIPSSVISAYPAAVSRFQGVLNSLSGANNVPITVNIFKEKSEGNLSKDVIAALKRKEGYYVEVRSDGIRLIGADELGVLYGLTTLKKMAVKWGGNIPRGHVLDWPDHKYRLLHITVINLTVKDAKDLIVKASESKFNGLIMEIESGWTELSSLRVQPIRKPELEKPLTKEDLKVILRFARENGLEVIPELKLLTHQDKFFRRYYPELMYNEWTYDPGKEETYSVVLPVLDEIIGIVNPRAFHIGHDEVAGADPTKKRILNEGEEALPPELFLKDVLRLHSYLKERGIETWMWGDMLLGKEEFPEMLQRHLHGASGYADLRGRIPKDIVIVDWHYADDQSAFPSALAFAESGHRVLGATWKKEKTIRNFSRYVASMPSGGEGMVATTWAHVPKKEWAVVDNIIGISADAFWNAR